MKTKLALVAAAGLAMAATSAEAGGFRYSSAGGNLGNWAYNDAQSGGSAKVYGFGAGETQTESIAEGESWRGYRASGAWAGSANRSSFRALKGMGSAQSSSSAVAGSGVGAGIGFKSGGLSFHGSKGRR